ncbi:hypothetical protein [Flavobacterium alkalisoli]|uniref:hypothetical protein n=1 Tax=Flavobacterium alkalisoli TaxID=2602769 RepID=UPI003A8D72BB
MKSNLFLLIILFSIYSCKNQKQNYNTKVIGSWEICVSGHNGVLEHPNHCPEITFFPNGYGVLEASDPSCKFQWKTDKDTIYFSFPSSYDKEQFLSKNSEFKYKVYNKDNLINLKFSEKTNGNWYLLSRESINKP